MKIKRVSINNKKRCFIVETNRQSFEYPYSKLTLKPSTRKCISAVNIDQEIGSEGFECHFSSGEIEAVHIEQVLEWNKDPAYLCDILLHQLSVSALKALAKVEMPRRELARRLQTSPKQIYRLLDPTFYGKSINQMVKLLYVLGEQVEITSSKITSKTYS